MKSKLVLKNAGRACGVAILTAGVLAACGGGGGDKSAPSTHAPSRAALPAAPAGLAYTPESSVYTRGDHVDIVPHSSGGAITNYTVSPELPEGFVLDSVSGEITGWPTEISSAADYTVTGSNSAGKADAHVRIEVKDAAPTPISLHYPTDHFTFTRGTAIDDLWPTSEGGAIAHYEIVPSLPEGLHIDPQTGHIYGTPTGLMANQKFSVTGTSSDGSHSTPVELQISVVPGVVAPANLSYDSSVIVATEAHAIPTDKAHTTGGDPTHYSVAPPLPEGLTINEKTGEISGSPKRAQERTAYTVIARNGGGETETTVEIVVQSDTAWQAINSPKELRSMHTATLMQGDEVMIAGGRGANGKALATAEIYSVKANQWSAAKAMSHAREGATAFSINHGTQVLVIGGTDGKDPVSAPELYDRSTNTWKVLNPIPHPRLHATITLAGRYSDKVLVAGGYENGVASSKVDVFDMNSGTWKDGVALKSARTEQAAARLQNGQVLILGGISGNEQAHQYVTTPELYDVDSGTTTQLPAMGKPRREGTATLLQDGHVLVTGGFTTDSKSPGKAELNAGAVELYDAAGHEEDVPNSTLLHVPVGVGYVDTVLQNGLVLFTGGDFGVGDERTDSLRFARLYNPSTRTWVLAADMPNARESHTATAVGNTVIVVGGDHFVTSGKTASRSTVKEADKFGWRNPKS